MIQIPPLADIMQEEVLLEDDFVSKIEGWKIIEDDEEKSFSKDNHYWMENKSKRRWLFYNEKLPVSSKENFIIKAEIELLPNDEINEYKKQYPEELPDLTKKMQVLKSMLDAKLISLNEHSIKSKAILKSIKICINEKYYYFYTIIKNS